MIRILTKTDTISKNDIINFIKYPPGGKSILRVDIIPEHTTALMKEIKGPSSSTIMGSKSYSLLGVPFHHSNKDFTSIVYE